MEPGCIGKSNANNLPPPTDLTKNPYEEKNLFLKMQLKIGSRGSMGNCNRSGNTRADFFWKMFSSSRKRGGADAENTHWVCADPYNTCVYVGVSTG
jgi:hypothetical protein